MGRVVRSEAGKLVTAATLAASLATSPAASQLWLPDPDSEVYYTLAVAAGERALVIGGAEISGNVFSNDEVDLKLGSRVTGNVSAVRRIRGQGEVTGVRTEHAEAIVLPSLPPEEELRSLADRVFVGNVTWENTVVNDVVFVEGNLTVRGSFQGVGAVIATGDIHVFPDSGGIARKAGCLLSLIALNDVRIGKNGVFRGVVRAGRDVVFEKDSEVEAVVVADRTVHLKTGTVLSFLQLDTEAPEIFLRSPEDGEILATGRPRIEMTFQDDSALRLDSVELLLDGVDRSAEALISASGLLFTPDLPLAEGDHTVEVAVSDVGGHEGRAAFTFATDTEPPSVTIASPSPGTVFDPSPAILVKYADTTSGLDLGTLRVIVDDFQAGCVIGPDLADCEVSDLAEGDHRVSAVLRDLAGNPGVASFLFETAFEDDPPDLVVLEPADGQVVATTVFEVRGHVSDASPILDVTVNGQVATLDGEDLSATVELAPGPNVVSVVATDSFGNQSLALASVVADLEPPVLTLRTPVSGQLTNSAELTFAGEVEDATGVTAVILGNTEVPVVADSFQARLPLEEGWNQISLRAVDLAGNVHESTIDVRRLTVPALEIVAPASYSLVFDDSVDVEGLVSDPAASIVVQGVAAVNTNGRFLATGVPITAGENVLDVRAVGANGAQSSAKVTVFRDVSAPRITVYEPHEGAVTTQGVVSVRGLVNEIDLVSMDAEAATVRVNGRPAEVAGRSFLLGDLALEPGENLMTVRAVDASGNASEATVRVTFEPAGDEPALHVASGNLQTARIGETLPEPLLVRLTDGAGAGLPDQRVLFKVKGNDGHLGEGLRQVAATTDAEGFASALFTLGTRAGAGNHVVEATAPGFPGSVEFVASALPGEPAFVHVDGGQRQVGTAGLPLADPFVAVVTDDGFNRLADVAVTFRIVRGGGSFENGLTEILTSSDSQGRVQARLRLGPEEGFDNNVVEVRRTDAPDAGFAVFTASGRIAGDPSLTSIGGVVLDNTNLPVPGVTVHVEGTSLATSTDALGVFHVPGVPVGALLLKVEGSTTSRPGTWPTLEFALSTVAGRENRLARPIYLLPLADANALPVSETEGGVLTLPGVAGFALDVAPGSVTFPDGSRSGTISVTPVHRDKVPRTPGFAQQPQLVVTIQPAGAAFDPPARLTLPNVDSLAPGAVTDLYSFDHDLGRFVGIGPATVSEDGQTLSSNEGVGVLKAGWHCGGDPQPTGTTHDCPICQKCDGISCGPDDSQSCTVEDECVVNDRCEGGRCVGDRAEILQVDVKANGEERPLVYVNEPVVFEAEVEHANCSVITGIWDFDAPDIPPKDLTRIGPVEVSYDTPGAHRYTLEASCDGDCSKRWAYGALLVKCPTVEIVSTDPDTGVLCNECGMTFEATVEPEDNTVEWEVLEGADIVKGFRPSEKAVTIDVLAEESRVLTVQGNIKGVDKTLCPGDKRSVEVFVPPPSPRRWGLTETEISVGITLAEAGFLGDQNAFTCLQILGIIRPLAIGEAAKVWDREAGPECTHRDRDPANAILHSMANCITAAICGPTAAKLAWDGHEEHEDNTQCSRAQFDFHNNEVGRKVAVPMRPDLCPVLIRAAMLKNELLWSKTPRAKEECSLRSNTENQLNPDQLLCLKDPQEASH